MDGRHAHIEVTRTLRLDTASFADALVGLRREMAGLSQHWNLGDRGSFELDSRLSPPARRSLGRSDLTGRLWNTAGDAIAPVRITATSDDLVTVVALLPNGTAGSWFETHLHEHVGLAHAAVDELCEELLYHASQQRRARELA
jgi:hypothetical protein